MPIRNFPSAETPRGFGNSPLGGVAGTGKSRRPSVEKDFREQFGFDIEQLGRLRKQCPNEFAQLAKGISEMVGKGASRKEVVEYFNSQAKLNQAISEVVETAQDWKSILLQIKDQLPKAN